MTVAEMHTRFKVGLDKVNSFSNPQLEPEEIDLFLNRAQERLIKTRYGQLNTRNTGFEETQKRTDDLRNVVETQVLTTFTTSSTNETNGKYTVLPDNYWFMVYEKAKTTFEDCGTDVTEWVKVLPVTHDQLHHMFRNPFKKPGNRLVLRLLHGPNQAELITSSTAALSEYFIRYIRKPRVIDLVGASDCELADHLHEEVVNEAVSMALESIENPRYQTNMNELNKQE